MASIAIVLRKEVRKDGTYPLCIRITKDRKTSYVYTEYAIRQSDWDNKKSTVKSSHSNSARLNNYLRKKLSQITDSALELETSRTHVTSTAVRRKSKPLACSTFFAQAEKYLKRLKAGGKHNQYSADKPRVKHFKEFMKADVAFQDITIGTLERFKVYLKRTMAERTAVNHLVLVRSVFSLAIKEEVCDPKYYPFGRGKIKIKFPDSHKLGLNAEEVKTLEEIQLDRDLNHARNLWLFSYYHAGMRISDVFRLSWKDIHDGRMWYSMGKNNKGDSLKIPEKAIKILDQYRNDEPKHKLVFPDLKGLDSLDNPLEVQRRIKTRTRRTDDLLKLIGQQARLTKPLTAHISRHTFAQLAGDRIDIRVLQKLYRHTSIATTIGYQGHFIHKDLDEGLNAVIGS
ncbi:integrase [Segetibacter sp. 3557_3]|uniref:site-specific integrase n=1 Tax=Segetibacter sp. 3557_3 TaxID=2547429 RepID=UPI001058D0DE|nr:site-specific integrase [Segetibacter sp. 3557_3]TDH20057.1 integrase [Segetibacter sp. 3557_3]